MQTGAFIDKVARREAVVGIVGLGYVGLPLALSFCRRGLHCLGFDVDARKVAMLLNGQSYIEHISGERLQPLISDGLFTPTANFTAIGQCDAVLLCVPTPLNTNREPNMTFVQGTAETVGRHLKSGQLVVLESTTYPGTTDDLLKRTLETKSGLVAGESFFLAYSPEREDPGNPDFSTDRIPKLVGGVTPHCREAAVVLYRAALDSVVPVSSTGVAEMAKLLENIFRSVNIALVNEMKLVCDRMDIDVWEVIDAAATKPFGYMPFYPGPGLGGHCIPIDPFYLTWKAREYELSTRFIELAGEINTSMPRYVVHRTLEALNSQGKALRGANVLVLGLAYKKDVDDVRESPSLRIIELLQSYGARVSYHDPHVPRTHKMRRHNLEMTSVALDSPTLRNSDVALILTDHSAVDYNLVARAAPLVVDTRNATKHITHHRNKIFKA